MRFTIGLLLAACAWAQTGRVEGRAVSSTGEPLANVRIDIRNTPPLNATSRADGSFVIDAVPPDRYTVRATLAGYVPERAPDLTVRAGETVKTEITLMRTGSISGRVVGPDGKPVAGATVTAYQRGIGNIYNRHPFLGLLQRNGAKASDTGEFQIDELPPGRYYVGVYAPDHHKDTEGNAFEATLYPDALGFTTARAVTVPSGGDAAGINITLRGDERFAVRGKVIVPDGYSPADLSLSLGPSELSIRSLRAPVVPAPDGSFEFRGYLPGEYTLATMQTRSGDRSIAPKLGGRLSVRVSRGDVEDVEFRPLPPVTVMGAALLEDGKPLLLPRAPRVFLTNAGNTPLGADGTFRIEGAPALRHEIGIQGLPPGHYLKAARFGGQDVLGQLDLSYGSGGRLDLVISGKAAVIAGVVRDREGQAVRSALVHYWREGDAVPDLESADQNGSFRIDNLPPGRYRFFAMEEAGDDSVLLNTQFRDAFAADTKVVDAKEGAQESIELKLIPREEAEREAARFP